MIAHGHCLKLKRLTKTEVSGRRKGLHWKWVVHWIFSCGSVKSHRDAGRSLWCIAHPANLLGFWKLLSGNNIEFFRAKYFKESRLPREIQQTNHVQDHGPRPYPCCHDERSGILGRKLSCHHEPVTKNLKRRTLDYIPHIFKFKVLPKLLHLQIVRNFSPV